MKFFQQILTQSRADFECSGWTDRLFGVDLTGACIQHDLALDDEQLFIDVSQLAWWTPLLAIIMYIGLKVFGPFYQMLKQNKPKEPAMKRIILHWTAGRHKASKLDRKHYHYIIEYNGNIVKGDHDVRANRSPVKKGGYAAHTLRCNSDSIGISCAAMAGAKESDTEHKYPITADQFNEMCELVASMCIEYDIPVTNKTVLSHAEVEKNLGIKQRGKWDIASLPHLSLKGADACGWAIRSRVQSIIDVRKANANAMTQAAKAKKAMKVVEDAAAKGRSSTTELSTMGGIAIGTIGMAEKAVDAAKRGNSLIDQIGEIGLSGIALVALIGIGIYIIRERRRKKAEAVNVLNT